MKLRIFLFLLLFFSSFGVFAVTKAVAMAQCQADAVTYPDYPNCIDNESKGFNIIARCNPWNCTANYYFDKCPAGQHYNSEGTACVGAEEHCTDGSLVVPPQQCVPCPKGGTSASLSSCPLACEPPQVYVSQRIDGSALEPPECMFVCPPGSVLQCYPDWAAPPPPECPPGQLLNQSVRPFTCYTPPDCDPPQILNTDVSPATCYTPPADCPYGYDTSHHPYTCLHPSNCPDGSVTPPGGVCPIVCPDGSSAPNLDSCPKCPDGSFVPALPLTCETQNPHTCPDGSKVSDPAKCPILCPDGKTKVIPPASCPSYTCTDGSEVDNPANCPDSCPQYYHRDSYGNCVPDIVQCADGTYVYPPATCPNNQYRCSDGTIVDDPKKCPPPETPPGAPPAPPNQPPPGGTPPPEAPPGEEPPPEEPPANQPPNLPPYAFSGSFPEYVGSGKTYSTVFKNFSDSLRASPIVAISSNFFTLSLSESTCPVWEVETWVFKITIDQFCSSVMETIWPIVSSIVVLVFSFLAFKVAVL